MKNYYSIIDCPTDAKISQLTEISKSIFIGNHPSMDNSKEANERFWEINEVYAILLMPKMKSVYDRLLLKYPSPEVPLEKTDLPSIQLLKNAILKRHTEVIKILKADNLNIPPTDLFPNNNGYNSSDTGLQNFTEYLFPDFQFPDFDVDFNFDFS